METKEINQWIDVLNEELELHKNMLEISSQKKDILVKGDVSELEKINKIEAGLILKMGGFEEKRELMISKVAKDEGIDKSELTLSIILKYTKESDGNRLKEIQSELKNAITQLKQINDLNMQLVKNSLDYIDFSINLFTGASTAADNSYTSTGSINDNHIKKSLFDTKR